MFRMVQLDQFYLLPCPCDRCDDSDGIVSDVGMERFRSRSVAVAATLILELSRLMESDIGGDVGGVIDTTISSLSISSSSSSLSLLLDATSFGEHCDFSTASR